MMAIRLLRLIAVLIACLLVVPVALAADATTAQVDALGQGGFPEREAAMNALVATGDARVVPVLQALSDGTLYVRKSDGKVVIGTKASGGLALKVSAGPAPRADPYGSCTSSVPVAWR